MDVVRCRCPRDLDGKLWGTPDPKCAIHGKSAPHPRGPFTLSANDRTLLKSFKIAVETEASR